MSDTVENAALSPLRAQQQAAHEADPLNVPPPSKAEPEAAAVAPIADPAPEPDIANIAEDRAMSQHDKDFFRANIRWLMAELDWARSGRAAEERAKLNP